GGFEAARRTWSAFGFFLSEMQWSALGIERRRISSLSLPCRTCLHHGQPGRRPSRGNRKWVVGRHARLGGKSSARYPHFRNNTRSEDGAPFARTSARQSRSRRHHSPDHLARGETKAVGGIT